MFRCMCYVLFVRCWGKGGVISVALQKQAAVALCGFFSVPLTVRVGLWKRLPGNQVHDSCSARWKF